MQHFQPKGPSNRGSPEENKSPVDPPIERLVAALSDDDLRATMDKLDATAAARNAHAAEVLKKVGIALPKEALEGVNLGLKKSFDLWEACMAELARRGLGGEFPDLDDIYGD